ncbi:MAG: sugar ABC transporter ATP-binding protein [Treponema sp.]|nr:sugar ABC transporter ATP-binding protein [Treponema sp.]
MADYILEMRGISKSFFGVKVLNNVKLEVRPGEVHVLLGENGAGKSTLIKILSGAYRRESGEIFLDGKSFIAANPKESIDAGVSVIYQEFNLVPEMPIYENIFLGKEFIRNKIMVDKNSAIKESKKYLEALGIDIDPRTKISQLSVAEKQLVEIAKAISSNVRVLVLDEPTASITEKETRMLFNIIRDLTSKGLGVVYISHRLGELFQIGDRCTVLRDGQYVDTVRLDQTDESALTRMMVGREIIFEKLPVHNIGKPVLEVRNLSYKKLLYNVSFNLHKGEILGIAGLIGSGRTELAKCIIGAYLANSGEVWYGGKKLKCRLSETIKEGIVYLSEDRKDEGLILPHTVMENIALPSLASYGKLLLNWKNILAMVKEIIKKLNIHTHGHHNIVQNLSGGNQQKVVIAKWLKTDANIYIFDEPTRGIDVGARNEIYNIMHEMIQDGVSVIMISSDMTEIMKMCDRIVIMKEGHIVSIVENTEALTQEDILTYMLRGNEEYESAS